MFGCPGGGWWNVLLVEVAGGDAVEVGLDLVPAERGVSDGVARLYDGLRSALNPLL